MISQIPTSVPALSEFNWKPLGLPARHHSAPDMTFFSAEDAARLTRENMTTQALLSLALCSHMFIATHDFARLHKLKSIVSGVDPMKVRLPSTPRCKSQIITEHSRQLLLDKGWASGEIDSGERLVKRGHAIELSRGAFGCASTDQALRAWRAVEKVSELTFQIGEEQLLAMCKTYAPSLLPVLGGVSSDWGAISQAALEQYISRQPREAGALVRALFCCTPHPASAQQALPPALT